MVRFPCLIAAGLLAAAAPGFSPVLTQEAGFTPPAIADRGLNPEAFVPKNWKIHKQAKGDLNRDKKQDAVLILSRADEGNEPNESWQTPRLLVVLLKDGAQFRRAAVSARAILCRGCGGVFGDPLDSLAIERGTFVFSHYGGSRDRWGFTHRFRLQKGDWYLIGRTSVNHDTLTRKSETIDENLLTGDVMEKRSDETGKEKRKKYRKKRAPLISLGKFSIEN